MPELVLPPGLAVVVLGLLSAVSWGTADYGGGLTARRASIWGVLLFSQAIGMVIALGLAFSRGEAAPSAADLGWAVVSGCLGVVGLTSLYHGLAFGRMAVVAPVSGVLGAVTPVLAGFLLEGPPGAAVVVGIGLALVAVVLVSLVPGDAGARPSGLRYGLLAGLGIGLFNITISRVSDGLVFGPLVVVRGTEVVLLTLVIVAARRTWRLPRPSWPVIAVVGLLDMLGNAFFIAAAQIGALAVASVLSSLFPVTTIVLAIVLLREPVSRHHAAGIACAIVAIALIAGGSTAA